MMKYILKFKLMDGSKIFFITPSNSLNEAKARAVKYSSAIFSNPKFVIRNRAEVVESEKWKDERRSGVNSYGSKEYLVSVIYNNHNENMKINADGEKSAYNKIKENYGINDFSAFIYDNQQNAKLISAYDRASFICGDRQAFERFMDNVYNHAGKFKFLQNIILDLKEFDSMMRDYFNGTYKQLPLNSIITIVVVLLYFVSPINLSFQMLPIAGQLDDALLASLLMHELHKDLAEYNAWKQNALQNNQIGLSDEVGYTDINKDWQYNNFVATDKAGYIPSKNELISVTSNNSFEINPVDQTPPKEDNNSFLGLFKSFR